MNRAAPFGGDAGRWLLRLALAGIFVCAGAAKIRDPQAFAESVASFRLLPRTLIDPAALTLPPLEILAGVLSLAGGRWRRAGTFCLLVLLGGFCVALGSALARGLQVDCGCFGRERFDVLSPAKNLWLALGRDVLFALAAGWLYVAASRPARGKTNTPAASSAAGVT